MSRIVAAPSADRATVLSNLSESAHPRFRDEMFPALWDAALRYGVDPVGVVAQAAKETGWGTFTGRVRPWFYNPAGIKVRHVSEVMDLLDTQDGDAPLVHSQFGSWEVGAEAHVQHLLAWCGKDILWRRSAASTCGHGLVVDPRYEVVRSLLPTRGAAVTWADLGTRWTTSETYGREIEDLMVRLRGGT